MARRRCPGVPACALDDAGRHVRRGAAASDPAERASCSQPVGDSDQPAVQRRGHPRRPLGLWLLLGAQNLARPRPAPTRRHRQAIWLLALAVGTIGGLYGIGGGSILAPILIALGYSVYEVAPATLAATFLTSLGGIGTYQVLQAVHGGTIAPQWILGACLGAGGFAGSYCGARLQSRLPERNLRRLLGLIACLVAARYLQTAVTGTSARPQPARHAQPA